MNRKICVFTSSRAEYGLLLGVLREIKAIETLKLQILASGTHLSPEFGMTIQEIRADGFDPDEAVETLLSSDTPSAICKSMGLAMIGYGEAIERLRPDIVVLLGDRFETFCMAAAAQVCRVPVAHIHGGETTHGAIDEAFRHSITKMSHLHFASCEAYRQRIIQLGESPDRVFNVGALGVENIRRTPLMDRGELAESIGFSLEKPYFIVTFHPVTLEQSTAGFQFHALLEALDAFPELNVIFTKTNADTDGRVINRLIDDYAERLPKRCLAVASLGMRRYLSAMKFASAVIGNSSSGILEAPSFKVPTVNIGDRQKGRIQAASILNCAPDAQAIRQTIGQALSSSFLESLSGISNPYDRPGTCSAIVGQLAKMDTSSTKKAFYDVKFL
ncbi:MAG: UDP-N-acetylglucosamine 2-epimerase [Chloroflexi bacterium]|nr:UDP-N-acetylglucosamine 2-epimerase [Chloroflexota bacterium]